MKKFNNIEDFIENNDVGDYSIVDGLINVDGSVILTQVNNGEIPFPFGQIMEDFNCNGLGLTTLKNTPHTIYGYFDCSENKLKSFEHCPTNAKAYFIASYNFIESFKYLPRQIDRLYLQNNNIIDLNGFETSFYKIFLSGNPISLIVGDYPKYDELMAFKSMRVIDGKDVNFKRLKYTLSLIGKSTWLDGPNYTDTISTYYNII